VAVVVGAVHKWLVVSCGFFSDLGPRATPLPPDILSVPEASVRKQSCKTCELQGVAQYVSNRKVDAAVLLVRFFVKEEVLGQDLADVVRLAAIIPYGG